MGTHRSISLGFTPDQFPEGTHMCFIYNNEEERRAVTAKYLQSGITQNELTFYLVHQMPPEEFRAHLADYGVSIPKDMKPSQLLTLDTRKTYIPDGFFKPADMIQRLKDFYQKALNEGYAGTRGMGEMEWALEGVPGSDGLIEYEALINTITDTHPLTAICQYDARKFDGATLFDVLNVHPMMVVRGQVVRNPYYMPPDEFFKRRGGR